MVWIGIVVAGLGVYGEVCAVWRCGGVAGCVVFGDWMVG